MAYNSPHTGPEIDAAVQMLGQVQEARDSTSSDLAEVKALSTQVDGQVSQVSAQAATVIAKAGQVEQHAVAVEQAREESAAASATAVDSKDAAVLAAEAALASREAAIASEQAASQSQLAAGLSEQIVVETAALTQELVPQIAADSAAARTAAVSAARSAQDAAAVVTGGTAALTPEPGKIPLATGQGKIDPEWLGPEIARSDSVESLAQGVASASEAAQSAGEAAGLAAARTLRFISPSAVPPLTRNDGSDLQPGDRYLNTQDQVEYIYKAGGWVNENLETVTQLEQVINDESALLQTSIDERVTRNTLIVNESFAYKKKVKAFASKHPQYAAAYERYGSVYPQAFCIDPVADEILYISATGQVTVYSWSTTVYLKTYSCPLVNVSEDAVIKYVGGARHLYLRGAGSLSVFDITFTAQWQVLSPFTSYPIDVQRNFCECAGEWLISNNSVYPLGIYRSRGYFGLYNSAFSLIGNIYISPLQCGINEGTPHESAISKMQGMAFDGKNIYLGMGGYWNGASSTNKKYGAYGVRVFTRQGDLVGDYLLDPASLIARLTSLGFRPGHCENEGIQYVHETGKLYSLLVGATSSTPDAIAQVEGFYVLEEFCTDADAHDFSMCASTASSFSESFRGNGMYPRYGAGLFNPMTNAPFASWLEVTDYMKSVNMDAFVYYSSTISLTDFNGVALAAGYRVTIFNCNNNTFRVVARGLNSELNFSLAGTTQTKHQFRPDAAFTPAADNTLTLGASSLRWSQLFAGTATISTSDERLKSGISSIEDDVLDAWQTVEYQNYRFSDALESKGNDARWHFGVIAQRVKTALEAAGLDPFAYGVLCLDEWGSQPAVLDEEGNELTPEVEAGDRYGMRYEEALVLEAALMRRTTQRLEARLAELEARTHQ